MKGLLLVMLVASVAVAELPLLSITTRESKQEGWSSGEIGYLGGAKFAATKTVTYPETGYTNEGSPQLVTAPSTKATPTGQTFHATGTTTAAAVQQINTYDVIASVQGENKVDCNGYVGTIGFAKSGGYSLMRRKLEVVDPLYSPSQLWFGEFVFDCSATEVIGPIPDPTWQQGGKVRLTLADQWSQVEWSEAQEAWHVTANYKNLFGQPIILDYWIEDRNLDLTLYPTAWLPKGVKVLLEVEVNEDGDYEGDRLHTDARNPVMPPIAPLKKRDERQTSWGNVRVTEIFNL
jgi:hypothetical protein